MYTSFFGLNEKPFAITPNPRYLYMSERHAEALAHLMYGLNESGGFIQLTGEVGTGKTTVVRTLLEQLPQHADVAVILNPRLSPNEFLLTICEELGLFLRDENVHSIKDLVDLLNQRLLKSHASGRRVVVIVDEAQNLLPETLEQVRLLTNLETATHKLLQIILIGQPELRELLGRNELRQLAQRITGRYHLAPLSREDTAAYVRHRLKVAGAKQEIFDEAALREVHRLSHGVPRLINVISDRALLGAYTVESHEVTTELVRQAASEVAGATPQRIRMSWGWATGAVGLVLAAVAGLWGWHQYTEQAEAHALALAKAREAAQVAVRVNTPPPKPAVLDVAQLLDPPQGTDTAFSALFGLWNANFMAQDAARPCDQARAQGLECVYQKGSWGQLRSLNRPAILQLTDDRGTSHQLVIAALDNEHARVMAGARAEQVSIASISRYWNGDYLILWRPKVSDQRTLSVGMRDKGVNWLRNSLSTLNSAGSDASSSAPSVKGTARDFYDEQLAEQVAAFQRQHRLEADGVAGLQTQIALDSWLDRADSPVLISSGG